MSAKKAPIKVGYLGANTAEGPDKTTFGYMAARKLFGNEKHVEYVNYPSHAKICTAVARQEIQKGVVAIENTIEGFVAETIRAVGDSEIDGGVHVQAEVVVPIALYYLRKEITASLPELVISHTVAMGQCSKLIQRLKTAGVKTEFRNSTGEAAYEASKNPQIAAIASFEAEKAYHLKRIEPDSVTDLQHVQTRFWVLGKEHAQRTGKDKTAVLVSLKQDEPGALWRTLGCFLAEENGQDRELFRMKAKEERPNLLFVYPLPIAANGKQWEYNFLLEFGGHLQDEPIHQGLTAFKQSGISLAPARFLGSYADVTSVP